MIRRPPRSTLFPYRRSSDLEPGRKSIHARRQRAGGSLVGPAAGSRPEPARGGEDGVLLRAVGGSRSEEHTSELQARQYLVCRLLLEKKKRLNICHSYIPKPD